ncbi:hypothetical protein B0H11DRAFT_2062778 [Mycena galericulata]|nr:hypothetical protein B0H11DRAFT_2062778 [Mycena galericulata]
MNQVTSRALESNHHDAYRNEPPGMTRSSATPYSHLRRFPPHLLESNNVPSEAERLEIQAILDEDSVLLTDLDLIHEEERERILLHIQQGRGILSVVRRLPFDILFELFIRLRGEPKIIWLLGRVCRQWRAVTISSPALWSYICPGLPLLAIATHLEKSKPCLLTINLGSSETSALRLVAQHSQRWEVLILDARQRPDMAPVLAQIHELPFLRRVDYRENTRSEPIRAFEIAPHLSEAIVHSGTSVILPWMQLERVFLVYRLLDVSLDQLKLAMSLVELNLFSVVWRNIHAPAPGQKLKQPITPIHLPRLRRLHVSEPSVLSNLTCPSLEELFLGQDVDMSVIPFLERSACRMRTLSITCVLSMGSDIIPILNHTPTLFELRLIGMQGVEELLTYLTTPPDDVQSRLPGPELHAITLNGYHTEHQCALFAKMMESRRESQLCPALSVCVMASWRTGKPNHEHHNISPALATTLSELRERGFEVEWLGADAGRAKFHSWESVYLWPWQWY